MNQKALIIGSTVADVHIDLDHIPSVEEDVNAYDQHITLGGCAHNVSHMFHLFHVPYTLFSPVGTGIYGKFVKEALKEKGILDPVRSDEENGCCYCLVDKDGNRSFVVIRGAEYNFKKEWFDALDMNQYNTIYVCGLEIEAPTGENIVEFLEREKDKNIWYAPGARILELPEVLQERVINLCPYLHLNAKEITGYVKKYMNQDVSKEDAMALMYERTKKMIVVTNGSEEVTVINEDGFSHYPCITIEQIDGTGAGDAHLGTLLSQLQLGRSLEEAMHDANIIGAMVANNKETILSEHEFKQIKL